MIVKAPVDPLQHPIILVVDDVSAIVEELIELLRLIDMPAVGATSIDAAIDRLEQHETIRVMVCDVHLHGENGFTIAQKVGQRGRLDGRDLRYVFVTGDTRLVEHGAGGNSRMLAKPVRPRTLIETIGGLLVERG